MKIEKETRAKENFWAVLCPKVSVCPSIYLDVSLGGKTEDKIKANWKKWSQFETFSQRRPGERRYCGLPSKLRILLTKLFSWRIIFNLCSCISIWELKCCRHAARRDRLLWCAIKTQPNLAKLISSFCEWSLNFSREFNDNLKLEM